MNNAIQLNGDIDPSLQDIESWLMATWKEFLEISNIDDHSDFFELGANSLALIKLISRIEQRYGLSNLPVEHILENSSIQSMAKMIYQFYFSTDSRE